MTYQIKFKILLPRVEVHELSGRAAAERHVRDAGAGQDPQQGTRAQGDRVPEDAQHAQEVGCTKKIFMFDRKLFFFFLAVMVYKGRNVSIILVKRHFVPHLWRFKICQ